MPALTEALDVGATGFDVGAVVVGAVVVGAVVGDGVGLVVGELVGVALVVGDVVGVGVEVGEDVGLLVAVAEGWVTGAFPPDWDVDVDVGSAS